MEWNPILRPPLSLFYHAGRPCGSPTRTAVEVALFGRKKRKPLQCAPVMALAACAAGSPVQRSTRAISGKARGTTTETNHEQATADRPGVVLYPRQRRQA